MRQLKNQSSCIMSNMVAKLLAVCAVIVVCGMISESSAQHRYAGYGNYGYGHQARPPYYEQRPAPGFAPGGYQPNNAYAEQLPPGVSVQEAEWVCKNPKTGDMLIISSEDLPQINPGMVGQQQPNYPQPTFPPVNPQPSFPQPIPGFTTENPQPPPTTAAPNTNGEGLIQIRSRE